MFSIGKGIGGRIVRPSRGPGEVHQGALYDSVEGIAATIVLEFGPLRPNESFPLGEGHLPVTIGDIFDESGQPRRIFRHLELKIGGPTSVGVDSLICELVGLCQQSHRLPSQALGVNALSSRFGGHFLQRFGHRLSLVGLGQSILFQKLQKLSPSAIGAEHIPDVVKSAGYYGGQLVQSGLLGRV